MTPVAQPHRRIPFHIRQQVEAQLKKDEDLGVIERISGPTPWISPIVVVPKPKAPGQIRVCIDMRQPNKAILRERHPTPTINEMIHELNGATVFSKLDLNQGYNQLELDESSRYITTFSTHLGLFRYKRLNFGISSAAEVFQKAIRDSLAGLTGVCNISDDILVYGKTQREHDENLRACFSRLRDNNLTLNKEKCVYNKQHLDFFGYTFSEQGLMTDPKKVADIINLQPPENASEVRSLLGMTNFLSRFIPSYSTLTEPLRVLTHKNAVWKWSRDQQRALDEIKSTLSNSQCLSYFDESLETTIYTDASPVGLGAILTQKDPARDNIRVVAYGSRSLTPVEQRYSQTEREALAISWSCKHFHLYVYGQPVTIVTDHKPLVSIFNKPNSNPPVRIERWSLNLQQYAVTVVYQPGSSNPADYLSRHPRHTSSKSSERFTEEYVNYVTDHAVPIAMALAEVKAETVKDVTLQAVMAAVSSGRWHDPDPGAKINMKVFESFRKVAAELTVNLEHSVLLRLNRIVIPESLQLRAVQLAHAGHQGLTKTKALIREKVWFPGIDRLVEQQVASCHACQVVTPVNQREPLRMSQLPQAPWTELSADFASVHDGTYLLVIHDDYSRFPVVETLQSLTAAVVIPKLDKVFAEYGTPAILKTDNGPPFNSHSFQTFCSNLGVHHRRITPRWPRANGECERFVKTVKKSVKTAHIEGKNWVKEMNAFLRNYRATPHSTTGVAPATVMFGRPMSTTLPHINKPQDDTQIRERDERMKDRMKQYADNKSYVKPSAIAPGDVVLVREPSTIACKQPMFQPEPLTVVQRKGSMVTAQRGQQLVTRNSSFFKPVQTTSQPLKEEGEDIIIADDRHQRGSSRSNSSRSNSSRSNSSRSNSSRSNSSRSNSRSSISSQLQPQLHQQQQAVTTQLPKVVLPQLYPPTDPHARVNLHRG